MKPEMITIHCSDSPNGRHVSVDEIRRWHTDPPPKGRGWKDIGYHSVIEISGAIGDGRAEDTVGAHVEGHNDGNLGVCMVGKDKFTQAQFDALRWLLDQWLKCYGITHDKIFAHYEWDTAIAQGKTCPNMKIGRIKAWYVSGSQEAILPYLLDPSEAIPTSSAPATA